MTAGAFSRPLGIHDLRGRRRHRPGHAGPGRGRRPGRVGLAYPNGESRTVPTTYECQDVQLGDLPAIRAQLRNDGPPELVMAFAEPGCQEPAGFILPDGKDYPDGVRSIQRWR